MYESPLHVGHMNWGDPDWEGEIDPVTGRRVHVKQEYADIGGHDFEGSLSGPIPFVPKTNFFFSGRHRAVQPRFIHRLKSMDSTLLPEVSYPHPIILMAWGM